MRQYRERGRIYSVIMRQYREMGTDIQCSNETVQRDRDGYTV
jgi:hypothetical protein